MTISGRLIGFCRLFRTLLGPGRERPRSLAHHPVKFVKNEYEIARIPLLSGTVAEELQ
jgi:hypothetical protein